jgi:2-(3-amino-3-carboxypropyl)histidine synthase
MRTLVQVPEGLKRKAIEMADETDGVIISAEGCYGACDLRDREAEALGCKKLVHVGHVKFVDGRVSVEYHEHKTKIDVVSPLQKHLDDLKAYKNIGLVTSLQFVDAINEARAILEKSGNAVFIGNAKNLLPGQMLGCNIAAAREVEKNVDCFLMIGSGKFHALGLALATDKPVLMLNLEKGTLENLESSKQSMLKQRYAAIALAKDAKKIGILISTKPGQMNVELAEKLKKKIVAAGRKAYLLAMDEIMPDKLIGFGMDAYVCTACPRIAIENRTAFDRPILNPDEAESFCL